MTFLTTILFLLDPDGYDTEDGRRITPATASSISVTRAAADSESWYKSSFITEKLQEFHSKYAAVPTDYGAKKVFERLMENLKEYLKKKDFCDRVEYTGNVNFG